MKMKLRVQSQSWSRDEYHCPYWIMVETSGGPLSVATIRYGCEELKEVIPDLKIFAHELVRCWNTQNSPDNNSIALLKRVFQKHQLNDPNIGWGELGEEIGNCLANTMGLKEFNDWLDDAAQPNQSVGDHKEVD